ncbi:ABC transporter permease [Clostridiaceae bacterium]|nr:ABC transporter permease [Clostridium sp.]NBI70512.1 ABC transporter permease [Clostridiaceae bacterium]
MAAALVCAAVFLAAVAFLGSIWLEDAMAADFSRKNLPPCFSYPFGTDWLGRDMMKRTVAGLSLSIRLGCVTAAASALIALVLGTAAALTGGAADGLISGLIDLMMGIPHMLLLILISCAVGKGFCGVAAGIALTHWPSLARLLRAEVLQIRTSQYVRISQKLGMNAFQTAVRHMLLQLAPQFVTGLVLLFPHAILHEASITFLGFGLPPETPAAGVILSESMSYLMTGKWWLALFPGAALAAVILAFEGLGQGLKALLDPGSAHE